MSFTLSQAACGEKGWDCQKALQQAPMGKPCPPPWSGDEAAKLPSQRRTCRLSPERRRGSPSLASCRVQLIHTGFPVAAAAEAAAAASSAEDMVSHSRTSTAGAMACASVAYSSSRAWDRSAAGGR